MTPRSSASRQVSVVLGTVVATLVLAGCARAPAPEEVALRYGRAFYASDADALWRLLSDVDKRVKDEATFRQQQQQLNGVARDAVRQLADFITAMPVKTATTGDRASVTLKFHLPDANAPAIRTLMRDWDEGRLNQLPDAERRQIRAQLDQLHREKRLPIVDGDETIELIREASGWKVFLNWANGARVQFEAAVDKDVPLQVAVTPATTVLSPGERLRVTVRATNTGSREITTRVRHRIEPEAQASHLALLLCPLFVPVTLAPGQTQEFVSEYLLLDSVPGDAKAFAVTYVFPPTTAGGAR